MKKRDVAFNLNRMVNGWLWLEVIYVYLFNKTAIIIDKLSVHRRRYPETISRILIAFSSNYASDKLDDPNDIYIINTRL